VGTADLYEVRTKNLNKAVSRNIESFPADFMFQLTASEYRALRFQFGTLERGAHSKYLPRVFMEQGVSMLSSVLKSKRARQVNIQIMRAFVRLRQLLNTHKELARKLEELERKYDAQFKSVFDAMTLPRNSYQAEWLNSTHLLLLPQTPAASDSLANCAA